MQVTYTLTLNDLIRLNRHMAERSVGMSLWLFYLCGITLGPVGVLGLWFEASEMLAHHHVQWGNVVGILLFLFFLRLGVMAVWHSPGSLKRQARSRVHQFPGLLQERHLMVVASGLLESAPGVLAQLGERRKADPAAEEGIAQLHQQGAVLAAPWAEVTGINDDAHGLYILVEGESGFIIPKRIFTDPAAWQRLREYLMGCWDAAKTGGTSPSQEQESVWPPPPRLS